MRSYVALRAARHVLAPLLAALAAVWQPPAAKEGQGDCDFRLRTVRIRAQCSVRLHGSRTPVALRATYAGPPWILLYPLKRRRSAEGLEAAERRVLTRRSAAGAKGGCGDLRSAVAFRDVRHVLAPLIAAAAAAWLPPAAKEGQGDCEFPLGPPWILLLPLETPPLR